jgi:alkanesulfonate monooxygenase SsuD/methylene tetrahydromethanopterin reductase-like flavin-dependent oxidoreductase (luciferase family)
MRIAAQLADGCNVGSDDASVAAAVAAVREHCAAIERDPAEVAVTVLDVPITGDSRDQVWERVERHRGRSTAAIYARTHNAGTHAEQRARLAGLAASGVSTVFLAPPHVATPDDVADLAPMLVR